MTSTRPDIICIGSVLWDIIGRAPRTMPFGADVPGRITRLPGGVAMNVAMTLRRFALRPTLLTAIGCDAAGEELLAVCSGLGIGTEYAFRSPTLPTDRYLAIEDVNGLVGAIADAHSLEAAGDQILAPLGDGRLGTRTTPWRGLVALDGNLTAELIAQIAKSPLFAMADLRVAPASPGKVERLRPLLSHPRVTLYVNLEEACQLCDGQHVGAASAAGGLIAAGARRVLVTDGGRECADGMAGEGVLIGFPQKVRVNRITGAGDTFMAAHIIAERNGGTRAQALEAAHRAAADYVSQEIGS